jgi:hypothetical protein
MATVSQRTLTHFSKVMSGLVIREIDDAFEAEGLQRTGTARPNSLQRRGRFEEFVYGVDQRKPAEVVKLTEALSVFLRRFDGAQRDETIASLERDGFQVLESGRIVSKSPQGFTLTTVSDFDAIAERATELRSEAATHPEDAIGHARELVESTCKTILEDRGAAVPKGMKDLVSATLATLQLVPSTAHEAKKGADAIKSTLLALDAVLLGVSELRLLYAGHGRSIRKGGMGARHAALAVGAALTIVEFLIATHAELL